MVSNQSLIPQEFAGPSCCTAKQQCIIRQPCLVQLSVMLYAHDIQRSPPSKVAFKGCDDDDDELIKMMMVFTDDAMSQHIVHHPSSW